MAFTLDVNSVDIAYDVALLFLDCAKQGIVDACSSAPARSYVSPGTPAFDDCCEGQLTVHLVRQFPSSSFPAEDVTGLPPCGPPFTGQQYDITLVRCAPTPDDDGTPPSVELLQSAAQLVYAESLAVWRAVRCCMNELAEGNYIDSVVLSQDFNEPDGGCVSSVMHIVVGLPDGCGCG